MRRRLVLTVAAFALGCESGPILIPVPDVGLRRGLLTFERPVPVRRDAYGGLNEPARLVIADQGAWAAVWEQLTLHESPRPALPTVDFQTRHVLVVAMGARPSSGYAVTIDSVVEFESGTLAFSTAVRPASDCVLLAVMTAPVDVVVVPRSQVPVSFHSQPIEHRCS